MRRSERVNDKPTTAPLQMPRAALGKAAGALEIGPHNFPRGCICVPGASLSDQRVCPEFSEG
jgi:hypothetical protein